MERAPWGVWACGSCALWPLIVTVSVAVAVTCPTTTASIVGDEYTPTYMHRILGPCHGPCPSCCTATLANAAFLRAAERKHLPTVVSWSRQSP